MDAACASVISGRRCMAAGLSVTSASLKEAGRGSATVEKALVWRGATAGVERPVGSSGSIGRPA